MSAPLCGECASRAGGGHLHSLCLSASPEASSDQAEEMGLKSDAQGCSRERLQEGGWDLTGGHCTPKISPGRGLGVSYILHGKCPIYKAELVQAIVS